MEKIITEVEGYKVGHSVESSSLASLELLGRTSLVYLGPVLL